MSIGSPSTLSRSPAHSYSVCECTVVFSFGMCEYNTRVQKTKSECKRNTATRTLDDGHEGLAGRRFGVDRLERFALMRARHVNNGIRIIG